VWGWCESRLQYLANAYVVFAFNAEAFDLVLLCSRLVTYAKESGRSDVKFHRDGNKIRWLTMGGLRLAEIKRLLGAGTSLKKMSHTCGLELEKALFPFDLLTSVDYLKESELLPDKASWVTSLALEAGPSQEEVDEARAVFARKGFANVGQYLDYYLGLDVTILLRCAVIMKRQYYQILGLDYIDSRKFTVSSLSALGAQMFLARRKRPGHFFPNHARMYSVSYVSFPRRARSYSFFCACVAAAQGFPEGGTDGRLPVVCRRGHGRVEPRGAAGAAAGGGAGGRGGGLSGTVGQV
jgi:hypothetical protein